MIRLCVLIPHFPSQTASFFWREIVALERLGVPVDVASPRAPEAQEVCHAWSREAIARTTYLFPITLRRAWRAILGLVMGGPRGWARCLRAIRRAQGVSVLGRLRLGALALLGGELASLARLRGVSHLHAHSCADAAFMVMFASLLTRIPYSLTLHGELSGYGPGQNVKWHHATFGVTVTQRLREDVIAQVPGVDGSKIEVVAMGVATERFTRGAPYVPPRKGEPLRLVSCGRLHVGKGHQDVVRAVAGLRDSGYIVTLEILGEGSARPMLESLVVELGLHESVSLLGAVDETKVRERLEHAHVFVLGSHEEAIGVATMEAMAMQTPVVVTDVGGVRELVRDGQDGLMVHPNDPDALRAAILRLVEDPALCERLGRSGRDRVLARFGSDRSARVLARRLGIESAAGS